MVKKLLLVMLLFFGGFMFSQKKIVENIAAAPNPFTNSTKITINSTTNTSVMFTVRNVLGKTVFRKKYLVTKGKNNITFYKNNLANGMYIYSVQSQGNSISKRFVIK